MRILYHHRTLCEGAEGIHIRSMIGAFRGLGHEVKVVGVVGDNSYSRSNRKRIWVKISQVLPNFCYELAALAYNLIGYHKIKRNIFDFRPDFVYERYALHCFAAVKAARTLRVPHVLEINSPLSYEQKVFKTEKRLITDFLAKRTERWICKNSNITFAVSTPLRDYLINNLGVPASKIKVLPNGVDVHLFKRKSKKSKIKEKYGLENKIVIGFTGEFKPWHGLEDLIYAFADVSALESKSFLLLVGDGPSKDEIESAITKKGLKDKVAITGKIPHYKIVDYLDAIDIAVSPRATFYASPMKILEYMAMSCAVVAPKMANIEDIITHGKDGILFSPGDKKELSEAMRQLVKDRELRIGLGEAARKKVETSMTWEHNAETVIQLIEKGN